MANESGTNQNSSITRKRAKQNKKKVESRKIIKKIKGLISPRGPISVSRSILERLATQGSKISKQ